MDCPLLELHGEEFPCGRGSRPPWQPAKTGRAGGAALLGGAGDASGVGLLPTSMASLGRERS